MDQILLWQMTTNMITSSKIQISYMYIKIQISYMYIKIQILYMYSKIQISYV